MCITQYFVRFWKRYVLRNEIKNDRMSDALYTRKQKTAWHYVSLRNKNYRLLLTENRFFILKYSFYSYVGRLDRTTRRVPVLTTKHSRFNDYFVFRLEYTHLALKTLKTSMTRTKYVFKLLSIILF